MYSDRRTTTLMEAETTTETPPARSPQRVGDYAIKSKLGEGSFSTVWMADHVLHGAPAAVKQVRLSALSRRLAESLQCELSFLSAVRHPNIVRLLQVLTEKDSVFLVLEFCSGGNLTSYIRRHGRVEEDVARRFMQQLGSGLEVLHAHHIIHRDLKPENILLSGTEADPVPKIADFGLSRSVCPGDYVETVCGSPLYMAPEVFEFKKYDEKVDMWSLGAILFELINGYPPFCGRNNFQVLKNIKSSTRLPFSQLILPGLHPDCLDMCSKRLSRNPANRLSFNEFYSHNFLRMEEAELRGRASISN